MIGVVRFTLFLAAILTAGVVAVADLPEPGDAAVGRPRPYAPFAAHGGAFRAPPGSLVLDPLVRGVLAAGWPAHPEPDVPCRRALVRFADGAAEAVLEAAGEGRLERRRRILLERLAGAGGAWEMRSLTVPSGTRFLVRTLRLDDGRWHLVAWSDEGPTSLLVAARGGSEAPPGRFVLPLLESVLPPPPP